MLSHNNQSRRPPSCRRAIGSRRSDPPRCNELHRRNRVCRQRNDSTSVLALISCYLISVCLFPNGNSRPVAVIDAITALSTKADVNVMRSEVLRLRELGRLPPERTATVDQIREVEDLVKGLSKPATDEEARELVTLFGSDSCFGLAWRVLHFVESAPGWPLPDCLKDDANEWVVELRERAARDGRL